MAIIGVPGRDDPAPMRDFVARHGLEEVPQAVDIDGSLWERFGVSYQPAWVFIDDGGAVRVHAGALSDDELEEAVAALVGR